MSSDLAAFHAQNFRCANAQEEAELCSAKDELYIYIYIYIWKYILKAKKC